MEHNGFSHEALFYSSDEEYLAGLVPFVADGLAHEQPVLAAVPGDKIELLERELGGDAAKIRVVDMAESGRNPGRIIALLRSFADDHARNLGLADHRIDRLALIANTLITNSLVHTNGDCRVGVWRDGAHHVVCEIRDAGHLADPLAGRRPVDRGQYGGRGLLMVHDLADLVRIHTDRHGTTIHTHLRLSRQ